MTETATKTDDNTTDGGDGLPNAPAQFPPVSPGTVVACLNSTRYWDAVLPEYASDMQRRADRWAIFSGALSAVGGLGVWATISHDARTWAQFAVSGIAFLGAIAALVPRVKSYGEMAGQARQLVTSYGRLEGLLYDAVGWPPGTGHDGVVRKVIDDFNAVKASKDTTLRHLPRKPVEPVGQQSHPHGVLTWPATTYQQAKAQMHPIRTATARRVTAVFR